MRHHLPIAFTLLAAFAFSTVASAAPGTIPIRGQLLDADGFALTGVRDFAVQFYDAETEGTALGGELTGTTTLSAEGVFSLSVTPPAEVLSGSGVWYAIAVDSDAVPNGVDVDDWFADRVKVESVPFALQAGEAMHVEAAAIADGSVSDTEFQALDGVSGSLQTQLDAKLEAADIDANTTATTANTTGIATNAAAIAANDADIATNTTAIGTKADGAGVDASQATQDTAIATNAAAIGTNTTAIATKADTSSVDTSQATQDASIATNTSNIVILDNETSANGKDIADNTTAIATKAATADVLPRVGEAHVLVTVTSSATTNGTNLLAAYAQAKALTPHGEALDWSNRAVVIVPPGKYDMGANQLTLDTNFVDLIGLTTARDTQYIYGTSNGPGTGVLRQTAGDIRIENLLIQCNPSSGSLAFDATDPAAYFPDSNKPDTQIRNCEFRANESRAVSMRLGIVYSGTFTNCTGGVLSFGGIGTASGTFTDCTGGGNSFGSAGGGASGTFANCIGGKGSFGGAFGGTVSGTASGTFTNCTGGDYAFGGAGGGAPSGTASGIFTNCTGGSYAFGGGDGGADGGVLSGTFNNCTGGTRAFGGSLGGIDGDATGGAFYFCSGGSSSFTTTGSPTVLYCVKNGVAYP